MSQKILGVLAEQKGGKGASHIATRHFFWLKHHAFLCLLLSPCHVLL